MCINLKVRGWFRSVAVVVVLVGATTGVEPGALRPSDPEPPAAPAFPASIRGVTISTHGSGQEWGSDRMRPTMEQLRDLGVEWVAIHPYAGIREDGTVRMYRSVDPEAPAEELTRPIREAHALGLKILIKPHLAYWGSFAWRGAIGFEDDASWERFWSGYRAWIVALAKITNGADGFVVGTELAKTLDQKDRWLEIIGEIRKVTRVPLTYAANWDRYESVPFWEALDAIGIQAYFPLVGDDEPVNQRTIRAGWSRWAGKLKRYSEAQGRPVLLTELGYNHSSNTAREPWSAVTDDDGVALQALCTRVALEAIEQEPAILGSFLWKWFPEPHPIGRNFRLATPEMRTVIRDAWGARATP